MRRELACACGTAALVLSANLAHAEEPKSSEVQRAEEARIESKPRWDLVIGGVAFFGASYLGAAFFGVAYEDCFSATWAYAGCKPPFRRLLIPLVGPLTYVGDDSTKGAFQFLFVGDAVLQLGGLAVAVAGAVMRTPGVQPSARSFRPVVGLKTVGVAGTF